MKERRTRRSRPKPVHTRRPQSKHGVRKRPEGGVKFRRGKPLEGDRVLGKARVHGVYGGSWRRARNRCRWVGVSEHAVVASVSVDRRGMMDQRRKHKSRGRVGYERQRREQEAKQRERKRGTVRGKRRARGLPVRGQQTSTNGKTARRLNRRYS